MIQFEIIIICLTLWLTGDELYSELAGQPGAAYRILTDEVVGRHMVAARRIKVIQYTDKDSP